MHCFETETNAKTTKKKMSTSLRKLPKTNRECSTYSVLQNLFLYITIAAVREEPNEGPPAEQRSEFLVVERPAQEHQVRGGLHYLSGASFFQRALDAGQNRHGVLAERHVAHLGDS